jgi:hypothetical protein
MKCAVDLGFLRHHPWGEPGGVPWAGGSVSWRAAPSLLKPPARSIARRMAGAKRCQEEGCTKAAASGGTQHCIAHGGLFQVRLRRHGILQGAWGAQAVPARGLPYCSRWREAVRGARRAELPEELLREVLEALEAVEFCAPQDGTGAGGARPRRRCGWCAVGGSVAMTRW